MVSCGRADTRYRAIQTRVKLIQVMAGGGDDHSVAFPVNLVFSCLKGIRELHPTA
jgi:hypothetical protein